MAKRDDLKKQEREAMKQSEADMDLAGTSQAVDEEQVDATLTESGADADAVMPAEAAAVHTDTETAVEATETTESPKTKPAKSKSVTTVKPKKRSAKYQAALAKLTETGPVALDKAIELVKATSYTKFDGTVEVHARLALKKKESNDSIRGLLQLPNGAPRQVNAVVLTEQLIDEIATTKRADADLYLASPALMAKVAKVARILGPQGKMPNPKTGTVTEDPEAAIKEIQSGRIEYRGDAQGIVHVGIGKVSWDADRIAGNVRAVLAAIGTQRLRSVNLTSTMGPGIAVDLTTIGA